MVMTRHRRRSGKKLLGFRARGNTVYADRLGETPSQRKSAGIPERPKSQRGPSGEQQRQLATLCRAHGIKYPSPSTARDAAALIARLSRRPVDPNALGHNRGPTGEQQKTLAALCRQRGIKYPSPNTAAEAAEQIARLRAR
jgi:hypothetical protein